MRGCCVVRLSPCHPGQGEAAEPGPQALLTEILLLMFASKQLIGIGGQGGDFPCNHLFQGKRFIHPNLFGYFSDSFLPTAFAARARTKALPAFSPSLFPASFAPLTA